MASTLAEINDLGVYPPFVRRVAAAATKTAVAVGAETYDGTQYRILRRALSLNTLHEPDLWGARFARAVASSPVITAESSDGDIELTVGSMWDGMAGAYEATS